MSESTPDRIEHEVVIRAPRSRVWKAISDKTAFGTWFGMKFFEPGTFSPGENARGEIPFKGSTLPFTIDLVEVVPEERLSYHWHPYGIDPNVDYSTETPTLVTFTLEEVEGGTRLRVVESGFDKVPLHRRAEAWRMNDGGWRAQMGNVERYVTASR
jgi:uncharacterized protein YndB with AHSA1/START domain